MSKITIQLNRYTTTTVISYAGTSSQVVYKSVRDRSTGYQTQAHLHTTRTTK